MHIYDNRNINVSRRFVKSYAGFPRNSSGNFPEMRLSCTIDGGITGKDMVMDSGERVLTALHCGVPDRVPVNYFANPGIDGRLKRHFGLEASDNEGLLLALGVDFRRVEPPYRGPKLHPDYPERGVISDCWGNRMRKVEHGSGCYWDFCEFPLAEAGPEEVAAWPMPSPDDFDYSGIAEQCRRWRSFAVCVGDPGTADVINSSGRVRGMEQTLIDFALDEPAGTLLAERRAEIQLEVLRRTIEAAKGGIDFLWMGEDLGTQIAPLISMETFRRHLKPLHQRFIDLAASFGLPVMAHCCGSSSWVFDEWIGMGVKAVDTLQPEAANMAPEYLKRRFGGRLAFHGCISTAGALNFGSVEEVRKVCRDTLDIMMPGGGYCFAPTHLIQDNSPLENVLEMYRCAREFGRC